MNHLIQVSGYVSVKQCSIYELFHFGSPKNVPWEESKYKQNIWEVIPENTWKMLKTQEKSESSQ